MRRAQTSGPPTAHNDTVRKATNSAWRVIRSRKGKQGDIGLFNRSSQREISRRLLGDDNEAAIRPEGNDRRVTELLEASNLELERRRNAKVNLETAAAAVAATRMRHVPSAPRDQGLTDAPKVRSSGRNC